MFEIPEFGNEVINVFWDPSIIKLMNSSITINPLSLFIQNRDYSGSNCSLFSMSQSESESQKSLSSQSLPIRMEGRSENENENESESESESEKISECEHFSPATIGRIVCFVVLIG